MRSGVIFLRLQQAWIGLEPNGHGRAVSYPPLHRRSRAVISYSISAWEDRVALWAPALCSHLKGHDACLPRFGLGN